MKLDSFKEKLLPYFVFPIFAFILYYDSIHFGYALDDQLVVSENKFVAKGFSGIYKIFSTESFTGYFGEQKSLVAGARYRPLSIASFAIENQFLGLNPNVSHFINILLYALCGIVIFLLVRKLHLSKEFHWIWNIPLLTAMLFLAHPIHTEAVANIKGRDEIMALLFSLLSLYYILKNNDQANKSNGMIAGFLFLLGLLSKENTISFLAIIPLSLYFFRNKSLFQGIKSCWPLFTATLLFFIMRYNAIGFLFFNNEKVTDLMNDPFVGMNVGQKYATITYTIGWYFKLLLFPHPLTHDYYPYHVPKMVWANIWVILSLILVMALSLFAFIKMNKKSIYSYGIFFFFGSLLLVSNLFFSVGTFMNERFLFMPSFAFSLICAKFIFDFSGSKQDWKKYTSMACISLIIILYGMKTMLRVPDWKNGDTLNFSAVKVSKNSARINMFTGVSYFNFYQKEKDSNKKYEYLTLAEKYIDVALKIFPGYSQAANMKVGVLAEWHKKDKDIDKFIKGIEPIASNMPDLNFLSEYLVYLEKFPENSNAILNFNKKVGYYELYKKKKNFEYALKYLAVAYKLSPTDAELMYFISQVYRDFSQRPGLPAGKSSEYLKSAENFKMQAANINPVYGQ